MGIEIKLLNKNDKEILNNLAPEVFDDPIDLDSTEKFLNDNCHHIVVALDDDLVIGFISAVHYYHPDKQHPEMWINEVSVAPPYRRKGIAKDMLNKILKHSKNLCCSETFIFG